MRRKRNYINRSQHNNSLMFWYLFNRRNRMYNHNIFLNQRFKLCLRPLKNLYVQCYLTLLLQSKANYLYWKIKNIKERFEMYKINQKSPQNNLLSPNALMFDYFMSDLFLSSSRELYMLSVMLLNKNSCFYEKIGLQQTDRDELGVFIYEM